MAPPIGPGTRSGVYARIFPKSYPLAEIPPDYADEEEPHLPTPGGGGARTGPGIGLGLSAAATAGSRLAPHPGRARRRPPGREPPHLSRAGDESPAGLLRAACRCAHGAPGGVGPPHLVRVER